MIRKLYPHGKRKAFNITYDDGVTQDIRFVALLNKYGIKGTFNLNLALMEEGFEWQHENGMRVKRLPPDIVVRLYEGHEVASHTLRHPYMHGMSEGEIMYQLGHDKYMLSQLFGHEICGFAVPFDYYSELIANCARKLGFEYARMSEESRSYTPPQDYYWWSCGLFHLSPEIADFVQGFLETNEELSLCQIVGHSYDLDAADMWEQMEELLKKVSAAGDVLPMTNLELVRYLKAMRSAEISGNSVYNCTDTELWFDMDGSTVCLKPGERVG